MNKITRFLLLIFSALILFVASGQAGLSITQKGPQAALADNDCPLDAEFGYLGCANPGTQEGMYFPPEAPSAPVYQPAPAQPAPAPTPSCPDDHNYCDTNVNQMIHKHGGYYSPSTSGADANGCVYAFDVIGQCGTPAAPQPTQPAPQPAPQPQPQPQQPSYGPLNVTASAICAASNQENISASWSSIGAASYQATLQLSGNTVASTCVGGSTSNNFGSYPIRTDATYIVTVFAYAGQNCSGGTVQSGSYGVSVPNGCFTPAAPPAPNPTSSLPACPTLVTSTFCGQPAYDTCVRNADGSATCRASQNPNCTGTLLCQPSIAVSTPPRQVIPVVTIPGVGGSQTQTNTQTQTNQQVVTVNVPGTTIVREVPVVQSQPLAIQVASVECPANTTKQVENQKIVCIQNAPVVRLAGVAETKELPKTGLPVMALAAAAFLPLGRQLKRFNKGPDQQLASNANYLWEDRQFKI